MIPNDREVKVTVNVVGRLWQPGMIAHQTYTARVSQNEHQYAGQIARDAFYADPAAAVEGWLTFNTGDFQSVIDWEAYASWSEQATFADGTVTMAHRHALIREGNPEAFHKEGEAQ